ncbi:hypothetical protein [Hymenobacter glaciei]|uniref:hypothetical protein n=1 Tax=Hymenobacter glaciei TaxID=877209 RepID=UPI0031EF0452
MKQRNSWAVVNNPFSIEMPLTPARQFIASFCWTVACIVSWLAFISLMRTLFATETDFSEFLTFCGCLLGNLLIWWRGISVFWLSSEGGRLWVQVLGFLWCGVILLFQVACSIILLIWAATAFDNTPHVMWYT